MEPSLAGPVAFVSLRQSWLTVSFLVLPRSTSWHLLSVCVSGRNDIPQSHHRVVFMHHVVAVNGVLAQPVAEAEEKQDPLVRTQLGHVLARLLNQRGRRAVAEEDLVLLEMDMDRVCPIAGGV